MIKTCNLNRPLNHGGVPRFQCGVCRKKFANKDNLSRHTRIHSDSKPFSCEICEKPFRSKEEVQIHKVIHTKRVRHKCAICGSNVFNLKYHMRHHTEVKFPCDHCGRQFNTRVDLRKHKRRVQLCITSREGSSALFDCKLCSKSFRSLEYLQGHQSRVHAPVEQRHQCDLCGKSLKSWAYLKEHIMSHTGERPYKCSECGKCFAKRYRLKMHKAGHSDERPFSCDVCKKRFALRSGLLSHSKIHIPLSERRNSKKCPFCDKLLGQMNFKRHVETHGGVKGPFKCDKCGKVFAFKTRLERHHRGRTCFAVGTHSKIRKPRERSGVATKAVWHCVFCNRKATTRESLYGHLRSHVGEVFYGCETCGKKFPREDYLKGHQLFHATVKAFKCAICGKAFRTYVVLRNHWNIHASEKHTCCFCGKKTARKTHHFAHILRHIGECPHFCRICGNEFISAVARKLHEKTHKT